MMQLIPLIVGDKVLGTTFASPAPEAFLHPRGLGRGHRSEHGVQAQIPSWASPDPLPTITFAQVPPSLSLPGFLCEIGVLTPMPWSG